MNPTGSEISLYVDAMIVEAIIADPTIIVKQADMGGSVLTLMNKIKDYFATKFPDTSTSKVDDVLQFITPGAIFTLLRYLTSPWIAAIVALAQQVFNINVVGIIKSIYDNVKSLISDGKLVSSQQIDSAVSSAIDSNHSTVDEENAVKQLQNMKKGSHDVKQQLHNVRLIKMAAIAYQEGKFNKTAGWASGMQGKLLDVLKKLFSLIIKILLGSAGFVVAGDVIKKFLGIDDKEDAPGSTDSKPGSSATGFFSSLFHKSEPPPVAVYVAKQTKFKVNPSYQNKQYNVGEDTWAEGFMNNNSGISDMLVQFAKEVYGGLNGLENFIKSIPTFTEVVRTIEFFNRTAAGSSVVFLPRIFRTKKQIVDLFIDDVAEKAP